MWMEEIRVKPAMPIIDHDTKFSLHFRQFWKDLGVRPNQIPIGAPQANAFVETFIGKFGHERLNHFMIFSLRQLDHIVVVWLRHYHMQRPHRGVGIRNRVLDPNFMPQTAGTVRYRQHLGELIEPSP